MSEDKIDTVIKELKELKNSIIDQTHLLEEIVNIFTKYDQELLLEDDELREG